MREQKHTDTHTHIGKESWERQRESDTHKRQMEILDMYNFFSFWNTNRKNKSR